MYFIEKLVKLYYNCLQRNTKVIARPIEDNSELEDVLTCKHNFMPIDSTGKILACSKCGYLVTKKRAVKKRKV